MPDTTRTFLALAVPAALETRLRRLQQQVAGELPGLRLAETMPFHVTLTFLGDVDNADLNAVCRASAEAAEPFGRFELKLDGLGVFPNTNRPRVVWSGVTGAGVETLLALQVALADASARLRYPADGKAYHPHVTLGRFPPGRGGGRDPEAERTLNHLLSHYKTWHAGPFGVTELVVFSSNPGRDGPAYTALARAPLRGRKPAAPT